MAQSPFYRGLWGEPWEGVERPSRLYGQHFGTLVPDHYYQNAAPGMHAHGHAYPVRRLPQPQSGISEVVNTEGEFRINIDVQHFQPDEITVKTKGNHVVIKACHEERQDQHGFIMRQFTRKYVIPKDVDPEAVTSSLSNDGVLTLKAPKKVLDAPKEHAIPITHEQEEGD